MRQIFVLDDVAITAAKELSALAVGELGTLGFDPADDVWKPVAANAGASQIVFAVGNGTGNPYKTPLIQQAVKNASINTLAYTAEVKQAKTLTVAASGATLGYGDNITISIMKRDIYGTNDDRFEKLTVSGVFADSSAVAAAINTRLADSKLVTSTVSSAVVTITGVEIAQYEIACVYIPDPRNSATAPTISFTVAQTVAPVFGVGTTTDVKAKVKEFAGERGLHENSDRYNGYEIEQAVAGTKYNYVVFRFKEDKSINATIHMNYESNEIWFACNVTAGSPVAVTAAIVAYVGTYFGVT
jgi:hypothetical protein